MQYNCYRSSEYVTSIELPGDQRYSVAVRHTRSILTMYYDEDLKPLEMTDAIENFQLDPATGRYVNNNPESVPKWVIKQELEAQEEQDRKNRMDRLRRMFAGDAA